MARRGDRPLADLGGLLWPAATGHTVRYVKPLGAWIVAVAWIAAGVRVAPAEDIYTWTDERGGTHYSNRGGTPSRDAASPGTGDSEVGWESVLDRQKGGPDFQEKTEAAINSLQMERLRKKRDREHAQEELEATRASIVRAQSMNPPEIPTLRAREATQITELRRIDVEIGLLEQRIVQLRALKSVEKDQRSAQ